MFSLTLTRIDRQLSNAVVLLIACAMASVSACGGRPVRQDFSVLSNATRIEVHDVGVRPLAVVTDPERIKVAGDYIKKYEQGWRKPRLQGSAMSKRRFDFWDGDRFLGEFGINPTSLTADGYYQEAPAEEIARIAAVFELEWPPK